MGKILSPDTKIVLPKLHPIQQAVHDSKARFKVLVMGRRGGKSMLALLEAADRAINLGQKVWFVSPTYNNSMTHWRAANRLFGDLPTYKNVQQKYFEFERRTKEGGTVVGSVAFKSGHMPENLRGDGLDYIVVDEAAFQDENLWGDVLRPSLSDRRGGALLISTPNGVSNWFYFAYVAGIDPLNTEWAAWQYPTAANPYIHKDEIEHAKQDLPSLKFRQEYLAEFVSDAGGVFRGAEKVAVNKPSDPVPGETYYAGIDWGRKNDFTVVSIFNSKGEQCKIERFTDIGWEVQTQRVEIIHERWNFARIYAEGNAAGAPVIEHLQKAGLPIEPVYMSNPLKTTLVERLAANIETGRISLISTDLPEGKQQVAEMLSFSLRSTRSGLITYSAPTGWHDDIVIATMLVNQVFVEEKKNVIEVIRNPFYGGINYASNRSVL